jgi:2-phospho-L-lactate guanylyltransferase
VAPSTRTGCSSCRGLCRACRPAALGPILAAGDAAGTPSVVLAPDRHGRGTNALLLDPPDVIDPAFGVSSRSGHRVARVVSGRGLRRGARRPRARRRTQPDDLLLAEAEAAARGRDGVGVGD